MKSVQHDALFSRSADVGVLVAVEVELDATLALMQPAPDQDHVLKVFWRESIYYFGTLGTYTCALSMCEKGSIGRDGSIQAGTRLLERWHPRALFLIGIAFGKNVNDQKQMLGDILVSTQVCPYDSARVGATTTEQRGPRPEAGLTLLNRVKNLRFRWKPDSNADERKPIFGPIISGEELVDNIDRKRQLFLAFPDAVGGEMEGAGAYAAAERARVEWLIIKSICDWADGTKNKDAQPLAAVNSATLLKALLLEPGLADALARPTGTIAAELAPRPPSAEDFILENLVKARNDANQQRAKTGDVIMRFLTSGQPGGAPRIPDNSDAYYATLVADHEQALETWLNVYEDASGRVLNGTISLAGFNNVLGQEIIELCDIEGPQTKRLKPRESSAFHAIWAVYDQLRSLREGRGA
ncbi:hypothetical protein WMF28_27965 [Sorangium sp. So ce590]|uniref:5'-methylthioadenosine/S-adenosylhomocysteine nucleosidase family protein n=1 Tax=Sorangium sp. So ce590 TaxID=3133317 RepID=UPI003F5F4ECE